MVEEEEGYMLEDEEEDFEEDYEEDEDDIKEDNLTSKFNLKEIIDRRNKLQHELKIKVPDFKERIGRLNLDLFGDPNNADWESKLDVLQEELDHPMTRSHPIAHKTKAVVREIKDLQIEYRGLNKTYDRFIVDLGKLIDELIKLFMGMEDSYQSQLNAIGVEDNRPVKEEKHQPITPQLVDVLMHDRGGMDLIKSFEKGYKTGDYFKVRSAKASFMVKAKSFFRPYHTDPKWVANKIWTKYTGGKSSNKKDFETIMRQKKSLQGIEAPTASSNDLTDKRKKAKNVFESDDS